VGPALQIVFDANDVPRLVAFWEQALAGYQVQPPPPGFATWEDFARDRGIPQDQWDGWGALIDPEGKRPRIFFQRVPEGKTAKNRVHLDVDVGGELDGDERTARVIEEADRIEALGATRQREANERGEFWIVMQDPEGNEFCLQ
jgi:Glyoxalase-like domain